MTAGPAFSHRLDWNATPNRLAQHEARHRAAGRAILDLTVTNPNQVGIDYPDTEIGAALAAAGSAPYEPSPFGLPDARAAIAADYARRGAVVEADAVALTASSSESYAFLFKLLADPGCAVLVPTPSYPLFDYLTRLEGVEPRPYPLAFDGQWRIDWDGVDPRGARALCLVSPNNPTGSFVTAEDLARAEAFANAHNLALVVDEVFADYALSPGPDAVVTVAARPLAALTFCLGGLSKAAGLPQMKLGWIATVGPRDRVARALRGLDLVCDTYLSVGSAVQRALPRLLTLGADIRGRITARVIENRRHLASAAGSACTVLPVEGGWAAIVRVPAVMSDEDWAVALLEDDGVLVSPGYFFDLSLGTTLVLSLLPEPSIFVEGVRRIFARVFARILARAATT